MWHHLFVVSTILLSIDSSCAAPTSVSSTDNFENIFTLANFMELEATLEDTLSLMANNTNSSNVKIIEVPRPESIKIISTSIPLQIQELVRYYEKMKAEINRMLAELKSEYEAKALAEEQRLRDLFSRQSMEIESLRMRLDEVTNNMTKVKDDSHRKMTTERANLAKEISKLNQFILNMESDHQVAVKTQIAANDQNIMELTSQVTRIKEGYQKDLNNLQQLLNNLGAELAKSKAMVTEKEAIKRKTVQENQATLSHAINRKTAVAANEKIAEGVLQKAKQDLSDLVMELKTNNDNLLELKQTNSNLQSQLNQYMSFKQAVQSQNEKLGRQTMDVIGTMKTYSTEAVLDDTTRTVVNEIYNPNNPPIPSMSTTNGVTPYFEPLRSKGAGPTKK